MYQDSLAEKVALQECLLSFDATVCLSKWATHLSLAEQNYCHVKKRQSLEEGGTSSKGILHLSWFFLLQEQCLLRGILYCLESWQPEKHPFKGSFVFFKECLICEFTTALLDRNPVRRKHTLHFVHGNFLFRDDICAVEGKPDMLKPSLYFFNRKSLEESRVLLLQKIHFSN